MFSISHTCLLGLLCLQVALNSSLAQCLKGTMYKDRSAGKNYTCSVLDSAIVDLIGPRAHFTCSALPPADAATAAVTGGYEC